MIYLWQSYGLINEKDWEGYTFEEICESLDDDYDLMREDFNIQLDNSILVVGEIGTWHGPVRGYKILESGNLSDCFQSFCRGGSEIEWFIDDDNELRGREYHHDGTNYYWFRLIKDMNTKEKEEEFEKFLNDLTDKDHTVSAIHNFTTSVGDYIVDNLKMN